MDRAHDIPGWLLVPAADPLNSQPWDKVAINLRMDLWERYGRNLTGSALQRGILSHLDDFRRWRSGRNPVVLNAWGQLTVQSER